MGALTDTCCSLSDLGACPSELRELLMFFLGVRESHMVLSLLVSLLRSDKGLSCVVGAPAGSRCVARFLSLVSHRYQLLAFRLLMVD